MTIFIRCRVFLACNLPFAWCPVRLRYWFESMVRVLNWAMGVREEASSCAPRVSGGSEWRLSNHLLSPLCYNREPMPLL